MNNNDLIIRTENESDYREVENLTREAFWNQSFPGAAEHYFVHIMREHEDFVPELAVVAEKNGKIIGNAMFCKGRLADDKGNEKVILTLGPIAVLPEYQRQGCSRLMLEYAFAKAVELGYDAVVNFGNPDNYVARGYKSCIRYNVCLEGGFFPAALLVKELKEGMFDGRRWYYYSSPVEELANDAEALEKFDAQFPPKEKKWQPSQEEFFIHSHSMLRE